MAFGIFIVDIPDYILTYKVRLDCWAQSFLAWKVFNNVMNNLDLYGKFYLQL